SPRPQEFAAVDLGSNSFHMVIARVVDGAMQIIGRLKQRVHLAGFPRCLPLPENPDGSALFRPVLGRFTTLDSPAFAQSSRGQPFP
ncbi:hypothetical protein MJI20_30800, partial [Salmonella enterica subsp. enterica serovar Anatum]|nr:hypothetical protein [Salmonella enterica subsp. enterica serovar Anatum]